MMIIGNLISCLISGFQITVLVLFLLQCIFKKQDLFWKDLFLLSNCILLATSLLYGIHYGIELFAAWYSQVTYEQQAFKWRVRGPYWWSYWIMILVPFLLPQILWFPKCRRSYRISLLLVPFLSFGAIIERLAIIFTGHYRDYLPTGWIYYGPNPAECLVVFSIFAFVLLAAWFLFRKRLIKAG